MNSSNRIWTIPNGLSLLRFFLIPPILIFLVRGRPWAATGLIAAGLVSDLLDGYLARKLDQSSDLGRIMDPVIDKAAVLSVVFVLVISPDYKYPLWFFLFQIIREALVLFGGLLIVRRKKIVMESNMAGKLSAFAAGLVVLFNIFAFEPFNNIALILALGLTLLSTLQYAERFNSASGSDHKSG